MLPIWEVTSIVNCLLKMYVPSKLYERLYRKYVLVQKYRVPNHRPDKSRRLSYYLLIKIIAKMGYFQNNYIGPFDLMP